MFIKASKICTSHLLLLTELPGVGLSIGRGWKVLEGNTMAFSPRGFLSRLLKKHLICAAIPCLRTSISSKVDSPYVKNIRRQQDIKRRKEVCSSDYRDGKFLILDFERSAVLLSKNKNTKHLIWSRFEDVQNLGLDVEEESVFLAYNDGSSQFAINVGNLSKETQLALESKMNGVFVSLRSSLFILQNSSTSLIAQSHSLIQWKCKNKYCNYCGGSLENELYGVQKKCTNCKVIHYPMINPVGITLISNLSRNRVLLVRQPTHPLRMFTCIAGFIETGETIEENIRREVAEEVGLEVQSIHYVGSQHWSLQGSRLMIGCWATVKDEKFEVDSEEIEQADWFSPQQLKSALKRTNRQKDKLLMDSEEIWIPPPGAIAYSLIKTWLEKYHSDIYHS